MTIRFRRNTKKRPDFRDRIYLNNALNLELTDEMNALNIDREQANAPKFCEANEKDQENIQEVPQDIASFIIKLKANLDGLRTWIGNECINVALNNNGLVSLEKDQYINMRQSLLYAEHDAQNKICDVKSLASTIKNIKKEIKEKTDKGVDPKYFNDFEQEMEQFQRDFETKLSTNEGISELIGERLKGDIVNMIALVNVDNRPLSFTEIITKVKPHIINIPSELQTYMLQKGYKSLPSLKQLVSKAGVKSFAVEKTESFFDLVKNIIASVFKSFAVEKKGTWGVFDVEKLTTENAKAFADSVNNIIESLEIILTLIKKLHNDGIIGNEEQSKKIIAHLSPVLAKFDCAYLQKNSHQIIEQLTAMFKHNSTIKVKTALKDHHAPTAKVKYGKDTQDLAISTKKLQSIVKKITKLHSKEHNNFIKEKNIVTVVDVTDATQPTIKIIKNDEQNDQMVAPPNKLVESTISQEQKDCKEPLNHKEEQLVDSGIDSDSDVDSVLDLTSSVANDQQEQQCQVDQSVQVQKIVEVEHDKIENSSALLSQLPQQSIVPISKLTTDQKTILVAEFQDCKSQQEQQEFIDNLSGRHLSNEDQIIVIRELLKITADNNHTTQLMLCIYEKITSLQSASMPESIRTVKQNDDKEENIITTLNNQEHDPIQEIVKGDIIQEIVENNILKEVVEDNIQDNNLNDAIDVTMIDSLLEQCSQKDSNNNIQSDRFIPDFIQVLDSNVENQKIESPGMFQKFWNCVSYVAEKFGSYVYNATNTLDSVILTSIKPLNDDNDALNNVPTSVKPPLHYNEVVHLGDHCSGFVDVVSKLSIF